MGKNNEAFYLWKRSTRERPVRKRIKFPLLVLGIDVPLVVGFSPHGIWPAQEKKKKRRTEKKSYEMRNSRASQGAQSVVTPYYLTLRLDTFYSKCLILL